MPTSTLRRLLRFVRSVPDRLTHEGRREGVLDRLRASPPPTSLLVLCHGNLCRSPYAAGVLRRRFDSLHLPIRDDSAGFSLPNRAPPADALAAAAERGIDLSEHRSQTVSRTLLDAADLIVVMDPRQSLAVMARRSSRRVVVLGDLDPRPINTREIADPYAQRRSAFDEAYARIDRCLDELLRTILDRRVRP